MRGAAGPWASAQLTAATFLRLVVALRFGAEAAALTDFYGQRHAQACADQLKGAWMSIAKHFELHDEGQCWILGKMPSFVDEAWQRLGPVQEAQPERLEKLLRLGRAIPQLSPSECHER